MQGSGIGTWTSLESLAAELAGLGVMQGVLGRWRATLGVWRLARGCVAQMVKAVQTACKVANVRYVDLWTALLDTMEVGWRQRQ